MKSLTVSDRAGINEEKFERRTMRIGMSSSLPTSGTMRYRGTRIPMKQTGVGRTIARMNPGSADHTGDVKPEGAAVAGEILLVYDWECPARDAYCRLVRIPRSVGTLRLVYAREPSMVIGEITQAA